MVGCARIFKFESTLNDCMICMCATVSHMKNRASSMRKNVKKKKKGKLIRAPPSLQCRHRGDRIIGGKKKLT